MTEEARRPWFAVPAGAVLVVWGLWLVVGTVRLEVEVLGQMEDPALHPLPVVVVVAGAVIVATGVGVWADRRWAYVVGAIAATAGAVLGLARGLTAGAPMSPETAWDFAAGLVLALVVAALLLGLRHKAP